MRRGSRVYSIGGGPGSQRYIIESVAKKHFLTHSNSEFFYLFLYSGDKLSASVSWKELISLFGFYPQTLSDEQLISWSSLGSLVSIFTVHHSFAFYCASIFPFFGFSFNSARSIKFDYLISTLIIVIIIKIKIMVQKLVLEMVEKMVLKKAKIKIIVETITMIIVIIIGIILVQVLQ